MEPLCMQDSSELSHMAHLARSLGSCLDCSRSLSFTSKSRRSSGSFEYLSLSWRRCSTTSSSSSTKESSRHRIETLSTAMRSRVSLNSAATPVLSSDQALPAAGACWPGVPLRASSSSGCAKGGQATRMSDKTRAPAHFRKRD
eukprot:CAMPEP_0177341774 /NCGR_PEP_ID=MMETSP0368-20130122/26686_1 /TAXON_ID=447022 ORGANISM="Scrippsiella hangoei-like, Strain SHHI-4" /NCGR_SAMPLE_ID=MMETSP0368 /ASSEMBLY_ACC=CAM_ASM_000363 /LENGTH=142 /DNA_ID=CAMNT_0018803091 /DNA_START=238 /DNA_END=666 /DNA_ORIENTATION=+